MAASSSTRVLNEAFVLAQMSANDFWTRKPATTIVTIRHIILGDQATNGLLLSALEEYEDSCITQKEDAKKTPAKITSALSTQCL